MKKITGMFSKKKSKNSRMQKEEILEELKKRLQKILGSIPLQRAIDYIDENSQNFNFINLDEIYS